MRKMEFMRAFELNLGRVMEQAQTNGSSTVTSLHDSFGRALVITTADYLRDETLPQEDKTALRSFLSADVFAKAEEFIKQEENSH